MNFVCFLTIASNSNELGLLSYNSFTKFIVSFYIYAIIHNKNIGKLEQMRRLLA